MKLHSEGTTKCSYPFCTPGYVLRVLRVRFVVILVITHSGHDSHKYMRRDYRGSHRLARPKILGLRMKFPHFQDFQAQFGPYYYMTDLQIYPQSQLGFIQGQRFKVN